MEIKTIHRKVSSLNRFIEIADSMRRPLIHIRSFDKKYEALAHNRDGVVLYHFIFDAEDKHALNEIKAFKNKLYTVWVGGVEVNDSYLPCDKAYDLADKYMDDGYDDVAVEYIGVKNDSDTRL